MKIKRLEIGRFGKLRDYILDLDDGFQILYGDNEGGKTTIMNFIYLMFYGGAKPANINGTVNPRQNYLPWDGGEMSGAVVFEHRGTEYRLEKVFRKSKATDMVVLWNNSTGEKEAVPKGEEIGTRFFDMTASAFEKSVFVGNIGASGSDDDISSRLSNLVSNGDETVSQKKILDRISEARYDLVNKSGRGGKITVLNEAILRLGEDRQTAIAHEAERKEIEKRLREINACQDGLKEKSAACGRAVKEQEKLEQYRKLEALADMGRKIADMAAEAENSRIPFEELKEFADECESIMKDAEAAGKLYREKLGENVGNGDQGSTGDESAAPPFVEITEEDKDEAVRLDGQIRHLQAALAHIKNSILPEQEECRQSEHDLENSRILLNTLEKRIGELESGRAGYLESQASLASAQKAESDAKNRYEIEKAGSESYAVLSRERIRVAEERLNECRSWTAAEDRAVDSGSREKVNVKLAAAGAMIAILSAAAGIWIHPYCFAGIIPALVLIAVAFLHKGSRSQNAAGSSGQNTAGSKKSELSAAEEKLRAVRTAEMAAMEEKNAALKTLGEELKRASAETARIESETVLKKAAYDEYALVLGSHERESENRKNLERNLASQKKKLVEKTRQLSDIASDYQEEQGVAEWGRQKAEELEQAGISLYELLNSKNCIDLEDLRQKHTAWQTGRKSREVLETLSENHAALKKAFLSKIGTYRPASCFAEGVEILNGLRGKLQAVSGLMKEYEGQKKALGLHQMTLEELMDRKAELEAELTDAEGRMPEILSVDEIGSLQQEMENCANETERLNGLEKDLHFEQGNLSAKVKSLNLVDDEIKTLSEERDEKLEYYEALKIAGDTMEAAVDELGSTFGPLVNDKTAEIFSRLTNGKYRNVRVTKKFELSMQEEGGVISRESRFLSNGTVDQAYLSLRLAVAELLEKEGIRLPVFLDDVFMQYDDSRLRQGLRFLAGYAAGEEKRQVILFTCHKAMADWAIENLPGTSVRNI